MTIRIVAPSRPPASELSFPITAFWTMFERSISTAFSAGEIPMLTRSCQSTGKGSLGVAANLPVRDRDAAGGDEQEPEDPAEPEVPVGGAAVLAPARVGEGDEDPADQAADVAAPGDVGDRERDGEVDHDPRHRVAGQTTGQLPLEDQH